MCVKALLNDEGKKLWGHIFPNGEVPIKGISPQQAQVEGKGKMAVYLVDWAALTENERDMILVHLGRRFGNSKFLIEAEILKNGLPLRADLVSCVPFPLRFLI
jgi:hypothetical protein